MLGKYQAWLARPFQADMDALHWFLFIGLVIVVFILWGLVLRTIEGF